MNGVQNINRLVAEVDHLAARITFLTRIFGLAFVFSVAIGLCELKVITARSVDPLNIDARTIGIPEKIPTRIDGLAEELRRVRDDLDRSNARIDTRLARIEVLLRGRDVVEPAKK